MRLKSRIAAALAATLLIGGLAAPADAASTVTLDVPNPTVTLASDSFSYTFTGTLHLDPGASLASTGVYFPYLAGTSTRLEASPIFFTLPSGGTYTGALFTVTIDPTSAVGLYSVNINGAPATFDVGVTTAAGDRVTISANYTVNVVAAPVPEPSAWVSASIAVIGAAGLRGRRLMRRRDD
ncbi:hypothetical protein [Paludisphaera rhizosphaerae]|uniref:hypothetical protein n=1 Tax=Paludisphaera rhizosphaerae TaxID=2711216 RepID=UPI0013EE254B|nr:hypothetical protein [Paludisphaera rhizosphaerae]